MNRTLPIFVALFVLSISTSVSQSPEFNEPWKDPKIAIAIDPF